MRYREEFIREFYDNDCMSYVAWRAKICDDINRRAQKGWRFKSMCQHSDTPPISISYRMFKYE